jgi:hypothetical protein
MRLKQENQDRIAARQLERMIVQYNASQGLTVEQIQAIRDIEETNPDLFQELASRKKWTYVVKNPSRALKEVEMSNSSWGLINHMPPNKVKGVVTNQILKIDKNSCDTILKAILDQKREED